jgi:fatty acid desaturase
VQNDLYDSIKKNLNFDKSSNFLISHIAFDLIGFVVVFKLHKWAPSAPSAILLAAFIGVWMFRSFSVMHEAVHGTLFSKMKWNNWAGWIFGAFCALPYTSWKRIHLDHHFWAGNLDRDPTMRLIKEHRDGRKTTFLQNWAWRLSFPYLAWRQQIVFWSKSISGAMSAGKFQTTASLIAQVSITLALIALGVRLFGAWPVVGGIFIYLWMVELINFPHHMDLRLKHENFRIPARDQHMVSRTCVYGHWFSRYVLLNFNYHVEHHLYPNLPCAELPVVHKHLRYHLGGEYNMSEGNAWIRESRAQSFKQIMNKSIDWQARVPLKKVD